MAILKQCDRCGKTYKNYIACSNGPYYNTIGQFKTNCHGETIDGPYGMTYDLCCECMTEFEEFMSNGGKSND